jgi:hypothetical protein
MRDGRAGDERRGFPRYPYNAGRAGLVGGAGYPASKLGVFFGGLRHPCQENTKTSQAWGRPRKTIMFFASGGWGYRPF